MSKCTVCRGKRTGSLNPYLLCRACFQSFTRTDSVFDPAFGENLRSTIEWAVTRALRAERHRFRTRIR